MGIHILKVLWSGKWCKTAYLFNVYMDELSSLLNKYRTGCYIGNRIVNHLMYADDLVVIAPSGVGLQRLLDVCSEFGLSHNVKYNALKSCVMCCRSKLLKDVRTQGFYMGGVPIVKVEQVKYLGHYIAEDLTEDADIARQNRVLCCQGNMVLRKFHMCSVDVKLALFRAHCISMYCSHLWWTFSLFVIAGHNKICDLLSQFSEKGSWAAQVWKHERNMCILQSVILWSWDSWFRVSFYDQSRDLYKWDNVSHMPE